MFFLNKTTFVWLHASGILLSHSTILTSYCFLIFEANFTTFSETDSMYYIQMYFSWLFLIRRKIVKGLF